LRKGAHSIGSNVRDAASYALWALARSQNHSALVPHANNLAQRLATVALYDREIHIRRAASATFQEHVGRTVSRTLGISCLGLTMVCTEFVSSWDRRVRKDRLLRCQYSEERLFGCCTSSSEVSKLNDNLQHPHSDPFGSHIEYQRFLFDHILDVVLRHWDVSMRELGSQSLRFICLRNMSILAPLAIEKSVSKFPYRDRYSTYNFTDPSSRFF